MAKILLILWRSLAKRADAPFRAWGKVLNKGRLPNELVWKKEFSRDTPWLEQIITIIN